MTFIICYHYQTVHQGRSCNKCVCIRDQLATSMKISINVCSSSDNSIIYW